MSVTDNPSVRGLQVLAEDGYIRTYVHTYIVWMSSTYIHTILYDSTGGTRSLPRKKGMVVGFK